jgi:hypothetical protein
VRKTAGYFRFDTAEEQTELKRRKALYNPAVLNAAVMNQAVERLLKINGEKRQDVTPPLSEAKAVAA